MNQSNHKVLEAAVLRILRPLCRILLRNGFATGEFTELFRKAYVDEAFHQEEISNQQATVSSISVATGLSRKEVKRLREIEDIHEDADTSKINRATRVITGWLNDARFTSNEKEALPLLLKGDGSTFPQLVRDYSGDIPANTMLQMLQAADCVDQIDDHVYLTRHAYVPAEDSAESILILGTDVSELLKTINHNLSTASSDRRIQRKVSNTRVAEEHLDEFHEFTRPRVQTLLEELDTWLSSHETDDTDNRKYVSVGVYQYEQTNDEDDSQ